MSQRHKRLVYLRKKFGVCTKCGENKPEQGKFICSVCSVLASCVVKNRREKRQKKGLCKDCGQKPPFIGFLFCGSCSARSAKNNKKGRLRKSGFTEQQIEKILSVCHCEYPDCLIQYSASKRLCSDHKHGHCVGTWGCPECYRGEICSGCNRRLAAIDSHHEWANEKDKQYLLRRPFANERILETPDDV